MPTPLAAPARLYLLPLTYIAVPTPGGTLDMVSGCYLVQAGDTYVLIDSGYPADVQPPPGMPPLLNQRSVLDFLADLAVRPDEIAIVIATHFDVDHAGYHDAFPGAEFVVQRDHYELARSGHARYAPARHHWDHPALRYRLIEGDSEILPGLTVLETGGHVIGHQSVLVSLPRTGAVLLAIDAVLFSRHFTADRPTTPLDEDAALTLASTRKLLDVAEREHVALTIFGHDGAQWRTLKTAPEYYD